MRKSSVTVTGKVEDELRAAQIRGVDFMTYRDLEAATGEDPNNVRRTLHYLRARRVVDVVIESDGTGWWFVLPPEYDTRLRKLSERALEEPGSRKITKPRSDKGKKHAPKQIKR